MKNCKLRLYKVAIYIKQSAKGAILSFLVFSFFQLSPLKCLVKFMFDEVLFIWVVYRKAKALVTSIQHCHCMKSVHIRVFLVLIFPPSDWIRKDTEFLSVFSPNIGKCRSEKLRIWTLFTRRALFSFTHITKYWQDKMHFWQNLLKFKKAAILLWMSKIWQKT